VAIKKKTEQAIEAAIERIVKGKPLRSSGRLSDNELAKEANLSRQTIVKAGALYSKWKQIKNSKRRRIETVSKANPLKRSQNQADSPPDFLHILANQVQSLTLDNERLQKESVVQRRMIAKLRKQLNDLTNDNVLPFRDTD
jgi:hypothetical protein